MIKLPNTLAFRLTLWYGSMSTVFLLSAFLFLYISMNIILDERLAEELHEDIEKFQLILINEGLEGVKREIAGEALSSETGEMEFLRLFNNEGVMVFSSDLSQWEGLDLDKAAFDEAAADEPVMGTVELAEREFGTRNVYSRIGPDLILHLGEYLEEKEELMEILGSVFMAVFLLMIPLSSCIGWLMARRAVKGIREVSRVAASTEGGHLDQRVSVIAKDDEVQQLASTFNTMLDRIRDLVSEMRELTDNIAHDLRSPLARIRVILEQSLSSAYTIDECQQASADAIEECDRLLLMINTTLDVAEIEVGTSNAINEEVDIAELTQNACELFGPVAEENEIDLILNVGSSCHVLGNNQNLQRMLANLLDNALKYTDPRGKVNVELKSVGESIKISIADTGMGIPEAEQARIFDRFYRCDQSRSKEGCGLGLSYSRAVAHAHGGDAEVHSELGKGSTFTVTLPIVA